jgi:peptide chain release factor 2
VLQSRLLERVRQEEQEDQRAQGRRRPDSWGAQMRSYVMNPYQMVKDLRTEHEVGNPEAVFDGDIDGSSTLESAGA